jgi:hypothetical protein
MEKKSEHGHGKKEKKSEHGHGGSIVVIWWGIRPAARRSPNTKI